MSRLIEVPPDRGGGITHILHYYKVNPPPPRPLATLRATVRFASLLARARLGVWLAPSCKHSGARGVNRSSSSLLQGRSLEHQFTLRFAPSLLRSLERSPPVVACELVVRRVPRTQFGSIGFQRAKPSIASRAPLEGTNVRPSAISIWYILLNDDRVRTFVLRSAPASVVPLSLFPSLSYFVKTRGQYAGTHLCKERKDTLAKNARWTSELPLLGHCERQPAGAITKERSCCASLARVRRTDVLNYKNIRSDTLYCRSLKTWPVLTTPDREIKRERGFDENVSSLQSSVL